MGERRQEEWLEVEELIMEHREVLNKYTQKAKEAARFVAATEAVGAMNDMLPDGYRFVAQTSAYGPVSVYERHPETGQYHERGTIHTEGAGYAFIGDQVEVIDGKLVVIDSMLGGGMEVDGPLEVQSVERTNQFSEARRYGQLLNMIAGSQPGQDAYFDCLVY